MEFSVKQILPDKDFVINGVSYAAALRPNTALFITKKAEALLCHLYEAENCLVFVEDGMVIPEDLQQRHGFSFSANPPLAYAQFTQMLAANREEEERKLRYIFQNGSYISETAVIGKDAHIEPGCLIGHGVVIGDGARILAGAVVKNAIIGDDVLINEKAVVGAFGFTTATDEQGNKMRIPTLGKVRIGNSVEIGVHDNVSCGTASDTVIEDYTKLDALIHVGHDVHIGKNVTVTAGAVLGGHAVLRDNAYVGINAVIRNRLEVGENAMIGMGSTVVKSVSANITVAGNPAKEFIKR